MRKILTAFLMLGLRLPQRFRRRGRTTNRTRTSTASSALAITADDRYLVIAEDHNVVVVVERATLELVRSIPALPVPHT